MDYNDMLKIAVGKLGPENSRIIDDLNECIRAGCTGGEIDSMVGKYVKDLYIHNIDAYTVMKEDITKYLLELAKRGLIIR